MVLPLPVLLGSASWYYLFIILPGMRRYHGPENKPRLAAKRAQLRNLLDHTVRCHELLRFNPREIVRLAGDLGIRSEIDEHGNWRFNPLERMMAALYMLSNYSPSRKLRLTLGWAANSLLKNMESFVECVIEKLDAPDSRKCSSL
jgi:hypothetical protein